MTVVAIHQPNYLPWLGFFHKLAQADRFVSLDSVQYTRTGFTNRSQILGPRGSLPLTVPVLTKGHYHSPITAIELNPTIRWAAKHLRALTQSYGRTPHWAAHAPFLQTVYEATTWQRLIDLNEALLRHLLAALEIDIPFLRASELGAAGQSTDLLIDLTRRASGTVYLSGPSGRQYLDPAAFAAAGLTLRFSDFVHPVYDQGGRGNFVPRLSALDLVLHHGPASRRILGV